VVIVVTRPPDRVAEVADVGIQARPLGIEYGQGGAEGQQGGAAGDIDSDPISEPDRGPTFSTDNSGIRRSNRNGRSSGRARTSYQCRTK
jgi:hypothetical protein